MRQEKELLVELKEEEMLEIEGGGFKQGACVFLGCVGLAWSLPVACLNPGAGLALVGASLTTLDAVR